MVVDDYDNGDWSSWHSMPEITATGYDFKESFELLVKNLFCMKKALEDTIEDLLNNDNISIINKHNNEPLEEETTVDYYTGEKTCKPIKPLIKEVIDNINKPEESGTSTKYRYINVSSNEISRYIDGINTDEILVPREYLCELCNIDKAYSDTCLMYKIKDSTITMLHYPITNVDCVKEFHNIGISTTDKIYIHPDTYKRAGFNKLEDDIVILLSEGKQ